MSEGESHESVFNHVYGDCPKCRTTCDEDKDVVEIKNRHASMSDWGPGENWTEVWKCPACGHDWEEFNGYP